MDAVTNIAPAEVADEKTSAHASRERRCLATGEILPKDMLLRFVVGPDQTLFADLAKSLPGRGMWVKPDPIALAEAIRNNMFAKSAKTAVKIPADFMTSLPTLMRKRCLDFLGLARRAGIAALGQPQVEAALKTYKLGLLLLADDAQQEMDSRITLPVCRLFNRTELGAALGHDQLAYIFLKPHSLTDTLRAELDHLGKLLSHPHLS